MSALSSRLPVVLLHGWPITAAHWREIVPQLEQAGFTPLPLTLPGLGTVEIPASGSEHYPTWHGAFNRAVGLPESLVPGRESAYYGTFLDQSAGPNRPDPATRRAYIDAYSAPGAREAGVGYDRAPVQDRRSTFHKQQAMW